MENKYLLNSKLKLTEKYINGKFLNIDFYGTEKELHAYIFSLNNHFNNSKNTTIYIKYKFYLPSKNTSKYLVNIQLSINLT